MTFILIAIAIFVIWHFIPKGDKRPKPNPRYRNDSRIAPEQENWLEFAEEHSESPAELAFLRSMISSFSLRPDKGSLIAEGIRLDFQVEEGRYRTDFLANNWLVIEIDGAAYHSSPEAVARDKIRDEFFEELGYTVLRIPARTVFNHPQQAIAQVRSALAVGKRALPPQEPQESGVTRLRNSMEVLAQAPGKINRTVYEASELQRLLNNPRRASSQEQTLFEAAFSIAKSNLEVDDFKAEDPENAELLAMASSLLPDDVFDEAPLASTAIERVDFRVPEKTGNADIDRKVEQAYLELLEQRDIRLRTDREHLRENPRLRPYLKAALEQFGRDDLWQRVA